MHNIPGTYTKDKAHIETDTSVDRILISKNFTYWGATGPQVPDDILGMFDNRDFRKNHSEDDKRKLHDLIDSATARGVLGTPIDWENLKYFSS